MTLPESIQAMVDDGRVAESVAYEISRLPDEQSQLALADSVAADRLNRDQVAETVRGMVGGQKNVRPKASRLSCPLGDGVSISVSAGEPLTWKTLLDAIERLRKEAKKSYDGGKELTAFARSLRAS